MVAPSTLSRRRAIVLSATAGLASALAGCSDLTSDASEPEATPEPDEMPAALEGSIDLAALRDRTARAVAEDAIEIAGNATSFEDADGREVTQSTAKRARGDAEAGVARHTRGVERDRELALDPTAAERTDDRYYDGETIARRRVSSGEPAYDLDEGTYSDFVRRVEDDLDRLYEVGTHVEFADAEWDPEKGVYVLEAEGIADEAGVEDVEIGDCTVHVDGDGVVVHVGAEIVGSEGLFRIEVDGDVGGDVTVPEPEWIDEVEENHLPEWTLRTGAWPSTTLVDDTLFVGSRDAVRAVDRSDGTSEWDFERSGTLWGPVVTSGGLYLGTDGGSAIELDPSDGSVGWEKSVDDERLYPFVDGDTAYFLGRNTLVAYGADGGDERWRTTFEDRTIGLAVGDDLYVGTLSGDVHALEAADGSINWTFEPSTYSWMRPEVVSDGRLYCRGFDGDVYALDANDGSELWRHAGPDMVASFRLVDDVAYAGLRDDRLYALDAVDGTELWSFEPNVPSTTTPTRAGDTVFVGAHDGNLYSLAAADGSLRWTFETDGLIEEVAVEDETVYVGSDDGYFYALDRSDGTVRWEYETGHWVRAAPIVREDFVYATGGSEGGVFAFRR